MESRRAISLLAFAVLGQDCAPVRAEELHFSASKLSKLAARARTKPEDVPLSNRVERRDLFAEDSNHTLWWRGESLDSSLTFDDLGRPYRLSELRHACVVSAVEPADLKVFHFNEEGLVYDANTIYNTDRLYTFRLTLPPSNRTEFHHHPLGTAVQPYGGETYHMVAETLPRLAVLLMLRKHSLPDMQILVSSPTTPIGHLAIGELVKAVGQSLNHVILGEPGVHHCASRLIVPPTAIKFAISRSSLQLLRQTFKSAELLARTAVEFARGDGFTTAARSRDGGKSKPLVYSAPSSSQRYLAPGSVHVVVVARVNSSRASWEEGNLAECESALIAALKRRVPAAALSIERFDGVSRPGIRGMVDVFKRATLMVGPHGAGFSGMIWAPEGAGVVEARSPGESGTGRDPFDHIARLLRMPFRAIPLQAGCHVCKHVKLDKDLLAATALEVLDQVLGTEAVMPVTGTCSEIFSQCWSGVNADPPGPCCNASRGVRTGCFRRRGEQFAVCRPFADLQHHDDAPPTCTDDGTSDWVCPGAWNWRTGTDRIPPRNATASGSRCTALKCEHERCTRIDCSTATPQTPPESTMQLPLPAKKPSPTRNHSTAADSHHHHAAGAARTAQTDGSDA